MTIKPSGLGKTGNNITFNLGGRTYQTGALAAPNDALTLTVDKAQTLVNNGQATPQQADYLSQYPWTNPPK